MSSATTPLRARVLNVGLRRLVTGGLRGTWVRGELPQRASVWAANHHSWWDGFLANAVLEQQGRTRALLMDGDNLARFGFLRSIGVIPAQQPRAAIQALREGRVLVVFPEGDLRAPGPLGDIERGASWLASRASAALVPVAVRVANRGHQHPEAWIDIGEPVTGRELAPAMSANLDALDTALGEADPRAPLPGFRQVVAGRSGWDERIARWSRR